MKDYQRPEAIEHLHEVLRTQMAETFPLTSESGEKAAQFCVGFIKEFNSSMEKLEAA